MSRYSWPQMNEDHQNRNFWMLHCEYFSLLFQLVWLCQGFCALSSTLRGLQRTLQTGKCTMLTSCAR